MADRVTIRISAELISALDRVIADGIIPARSRQDAFRHIAEDWLCSAGYLAGGLHPNISTEADPDHRVLGSTTARVSEAKTVE